MKAVISDDTVDMNGWKRHRKRRGYLADAVVLRRRSRPRVSVIVRVGHSVGCHRSWAEFRGYSLDRTARRYSEAAGSERSEAGFVATIPRYCPATGRGKRLREQ